MPITVESARQVALNAVRVRFSEAPLMFNPSDRDDALWRGNYAFSGALTQTVKRDTSDPLAIFVYSDAQLPAGADVSFVADNVHSADGEDVIPLFEFAFTAFGERVLVNAENLLPGRVDIANPQTVREAGDAPLGTFPITEAGDLGNDTGRANLRKRIFRRLTTRRGGFFHLPGYGLAQQDKKLFTATAMRQLQIDAEAQARQEPDVIGAHATVKTLAPGVFHLRLRVQDALGVFEMNETIDMNGGESA